MDPDPTPPPSPPDPAPPPPQPDDQAPSFHHRGNGNIAHLPEETRNKVNQMIVDGVPYAKIIESLGALGTAITVDHIASWKKYGHQAWLAERDRKQALAANREAAIGLLNLKAGVAVQDASRTIAAAQLYELLLSFEPSAFAAELAQKPELYLKLVNALSRLCEGEAVCTHRRAMQSLLQAKLEPKLDTSPRNTVSKEKLTDIANQIKLV